MMKTSLSILGISYEIIKYKSRMKEVFEKANIPVARGKVVHDLEIAEKFIDEVGYPVCVKPDNGVGAAHTYKLKNDSELEEFFNTKNDFEYIMEEFIQGEIHTFDGLVDRNGKVVFMNSYIFDTGVMETVNENLDMVYYNQIEIPEDIKTYGLKILEAFKVQERFFHIEFFRTKEGELIALEINARPPGGISMDIFNYSNDTDLYKIYAQLVNGHNIEFDDTVPHCCFYIGLKRDHRFKHINSVDEALVKYKDLIIHHGPMPEIFAPALGSYSIVLRASDKESLMEAAQFIMQRKIL